jgi:hypothetical protein
VGLSVHAACVEGAKKFGSDRGNAGLRLGERNEIERLSYAAVYFDRKERRYREMRTSIRNGRNAMVEPFCDPLHGGQFERREFAQRPGVGILKRRQKYETE